MSTSYYRLREPITSLKLKNDGGHDKLTVFENGANCGTLILSKGNGGIVALMFCVDEDDIHCPIRTYYAGHDVGMVMQVNNKNISNDVTVISEYGDVCTIGEIKERSKK